MNGILLDFILKYIIINTLCFQSQVLSLALFFSFPSILKINDKVCLNEKYTAWMHLGRVFSDVSQAAHRGLGSVQHHTPQASSGDPAGVDQIPTHVPVATLDPIGPTRERPGPHNPPPQNYSARTGRHNSGAWRD